MQLIDLQLLVTHVIGFLIVLWLLRRFAWRPVLRFLDERREKIDSEFKQIDAERSEVEDLRLEYQAHLDKIELETRREIAKGVVEGKAARKRIEAQAQAERRTKLERAQEEVRMLEDSAAETLRRRVVDLALLAAGKAIRERMDTAKDRELVARFIDEIDGAGEGGSRR